MAAPDLATTTLPALTPESAPRVVWHGRADYLHGANLPWLNWGCDFGCGADGGASSTASEATLDTAFAAAHDAGMNVVRWWVFPGEPKQILRDESGLPRGIDPRVYADFDAAIALARKYDVSLILTLFSGPQDLPSTWLTTADGRARLATTLGELFAHYATSDRIMTWQVINEPEWSIWNGSVPASDVQDLVRLVTASIHANSLALASVGGARLDGLPLWIGLGLDYYTVHWYDDMTAADQCLPCTTYRDIKHALDLDRPIVVGEFYLGPDVNGYGRLSGFWDRGFAGALAWSLLSSETTDGMEVDLDAASSFSHAYLGTP